MQKVEGSNPFSRFNALHLQATGGDPVSFETELPSEGSYRLFVQFKHDSKVHTAAFTRAVSG